MEALELAPAAKGRGRERIRLEEARRRMLEQGSHAVGDDELLGLLLESGGPKDVSALALADELLSSSGGLKGLLQRDAQTLAMTPQMGPRRTSLLLAAVELGRRAQRCVDLRPRLVSPKDIHRYLSPMLTALPREVFHVLALNSRNVLVSDVRVAEGTATSCPVDPRAVFAPAIALRASAVVLAHNHPAGDPEPSREDIALTAQLAEAGRLLCIRVLDHLVVGDGGYVSMLERGLISTQGMQARRASWTAQEGGG